MTELSPAAQAVWDAADGACMYRPDREDTRLAAAAALRAAANQGEALFDEHDGVVCAVRVDDILAIASELENGGAR